MRWKLLLSGISNYCGPFVSLGKTRKGRLQMVYIVAIALIAPILSPTISKSDPASLVVVVGRQSRLRDISSTFLLDMFRGKNLFFPDGSPSNLILSSHEEDRRHFLEGYLNANEKVFLRHWQSMVYKGKASRVPASPQSADAIKMLFASDPRTLAVVGRDELEFLGSLVRVITVDGQAYTSESYPLAK